MLALTSTNVNMRSQYLSKLNLADRDVFGDHSVEHQYAKSVFVLTAEERLLKVGEVLGI